MALDIVKTVTDWPVIVQGALGSALFWLILELGQRIMRSLTSKLGNDWQTANWWSLAAHEAAVGSVRDTARFFCLYGALHYVLKAMIVGVISFMAAGFIDIMADVGYMIMLYFLFRALSYTPHTKSHGPINERKKKFERSLEERTHKNVSLSDK